MHSGACRLSMTLPRIQLNAGSLDWRLHIATAPLACAIPAGVCGPGRPPDDMAAAIPIGDGTSSCNAARLHGLRACAGHWWVLVTRTYVSGRRWAGLDSLSVHVRTGCARESCMQQKSVA